LLYSHLSRDDGFAARLRLIISRQYRNERKPSVCTDVILRNTGYISGKIRQKDMGMGWHRPDETKPGILKKRQ